MTPRLQGAGGGAARRLLPGRRQAGGIAIAVVSAGLAAGLAGCGPNSGLTGKAEQLQGGKGGAITLKSGASHASPGTASSGTKSSSGASHGTASSAAGGIAYSFRTLDNPADPTFNQLLGFNNSGVIAGYFGSGAAGHPNQGYVLVRTQAGFAIRDENFPGSVQTQVTGLNDRGVTVGFWADANNDNFGFYDLGGSFHSVAFPTSDNASPPVNQLLGVNNQDTAVGFYTDASGNSHGYTFGIGSGRFRSVTVPGATSLTAAAINNRDDVAGFFTNSAGATEGFLRTGQGRVYTLAYPGASMTQALGVSDSREVVGDYTVGSGDSAVMHGFTWTPQRGFQSVDDPQGAGTTTINGVNDRGDLVGFYVDSAGNTDGFVATPGGQDPLPGLISTATPAQSASPAESPASSPSSSPSMPPNPRPSAQPSPRISYGPTDPPPFSGTGS